MGLNPESLKAAANIHNSEFQNDKFLEGTSCLLFPEDPSRCEVLKNIKLTTSVISFVGSFLMIFMIWLFRKYNEFYQRLILYLSISSFFSSITYFVSIGSNVENTRCTTEAFLTTYVDWSVLLWILCITFNVAQKVFRLVHRKVDTNTRESVRDRTELCYIFVGWILPLGIAAIPLIKNVYGPAGQWCWIKSDAHAWRLYIWYIWNTLAMVLLFVVYGWIRMQLKFLSENAYTGLYDSNFHHQKRAMEKEIKTLRAYPIVYTLTGIFPVILRLHNWFNTSPADQAPFILWILVTIIAPLQGAINSVVFGMDPDTRRVVLSKHAVRLAWHSHFDKVLVTQYPIHRFKDSMSDAESLNETTALLSPPESIQTS